MPEPAERLVNLALFLAAPGGPKTAAECRDAGLGYPDGQDDVAFARMFERDKDVLRSAGFSIAVLDRHGDEAYSLDVAATFAPPLSLSDGELATLGAVAAAMLGDPSFPLRELLRYALLKIAPLSEMETPAARGLLADEAPAAQGEAAAVLLGAVAARKRATFVYTNAAGGSAAHEIEPYGLFLREGRWYAVGRDVERDEARTYAVARMADVRANAAAPHTPDFERREGFDPRAFVRLPFQYGPGRFDAALRFTPASAWGAARLADGAGMLEPSEDGSVRWSVEAADAGRLLRWVIEHGPGVEVVGPPELLDALENGLAEVVRAHDG